MLPYFSIFLICPKFWLFLASLFPTWAAASGLAMRRTSTYEADLVSLVNANGVGWGHVGPRGLKQVEAGWRQHPGVALQKMNGP